MVDLNGHEFWTVILYTWPYMCIPIAFAVDRRLRAGWHLEDVSRPATGYRFRGSNVQMVFTSRVKDVKQMQGIQSEGHHERSGLVDCTNLLPLAVFVPAMFGFAAKWSSGAASVSLVCTPFVFLAVFSLTLSQVRCFHGIFVLCSYVVRAFVLLRKIFVAMFVGIFLPTNNIPVSSCNFGDECVLRFRRRRQCHPVWVMSLLALLST